MHHPRRCTRRSPRRLCLRARRRDARDARAVRTVSDWDRFADSWNDLEVDTYMADGGRYRRRRHAVYEASAGARRAAIRRTTRRSTTTRSMAASRAGSSRWRRSGGGPTMRTILGFCPIFFGGLAPPRAHGASKSTSFGSRRAGAEGGYRRRRAFIATASTMCWCCSCSAATSPAARRRFTARRDSASGLYADRPVRRRLLDDTSRLTRRYAGPADRSGAAAYRDVLVVTLRSEPE